MPKTLFDLSAQCTIDQDLGKALRGMGTHVVVSIGRVQRDTLVLAV